MDTADYMIVEITRLRGENGRLKARITELEGLLIELADAHRITPSDGKTDSGAQKEYRKQDALRRCLYVGIRASVDAAMEDDDESSS